MSQAEVGPPSSVEREAVALCDAATAVGLPLRLIGSIAVRVLCPGFRHLMAGLGRREALDVDLVGYGRDEPAIERLFAARAYSLHPAIRHSREFGIRRLIYVHPAEELKVDVFLDRLIMAHTIEFAGRLELEAPTVTPADLLLSKLQIHELTENDLIDTAVLLAEHELGDGGIDPSRLGDVLGNDWGFHHSAESNLTRLEAMLDGWGGLPAEAADRIRRRIEAVSEVMREAPKSRRWKLRARVGERVRWYEEVGDVDR